MKFIPSLEEWPGDGHPSAVTIGMFDGVHRGHQALLQRLCAGAQSAGIRSAALTFDRHPRLAVAGETGDPSLTPPAEKRDLFSGLGIDLMAIIRTDGALLGLEPDEFVRRFLVQRLAARQVVVGYDFRFGKNRAGDLAMLRRLGGEYGFEVEETPRIELDGVPVKSTLIRERLKAGDVEGAGSLLGRFYQVQGRVVEGDHIGRQLGYPTANIQPEVSKMLPANGVYAGVARLANTCWPAAINLGVRPTVGGRRQVLEAHLLGFSGDLYGRDLTLDFERRLRDEKRFPNQEALKEQIRRDVLAILPIEEARALEMVPDAH